MTSRSLKSALLAGAVALTLAGAAGAETIKIAAQEPGGSWYSYGATFGKLIDDNKAADLTVEIVPRGGGFANPSAVDKNLSQFGFTSSNAAAWAVSGMEEVYKGQKAQNIRTVTGAMQAAYTMIIARKAYVDSTGLKTLEAMLKAPTPPRIGLKPTGSQVPMIADMMFQSAAGVSLAQLRSKGIVTQAAPGQLTSMLADGRLDVYIENAPAGTATVTEMTLTNDMVFIPISDKVLADLAKAGLPTGPMPKGTFKGQDADYPNPVSATIFITNKDVSEKTVYNVLKTLVDNRSYIGDQHAALKFWDPKAGCQPENAVLPLHPGAEKLCKELGYLK
jgi:TRAP transporter TAXI family solute receptor